jgi:hypothetical protein
MDENKMKKKIIVGIILLIIWAIFYCFVIITGGDEISASVLIHYLVGIFAIPGYLCLYYGLSLRNRGIMIFITGLLLILPCVIFIAILLIDPFLAWTDLIIAIYTMFIIIWILFFILPSVYMISSGRLPDNTKYNKKILRYYLAAIGAIFVGMWFYLGIFGLIAESAGTDFRSFFFQNIWISIPIGAIIGPIIVCVAYEFRRHA